ncbi:MAG: AsnC family protein [Magnetococcales bacterium]|nr:AsnC family protein [Magnetococcales bacterium]
MLALTDRQQQLVSAIQEGLPLLPRPYLAIGERMGWSEAEVIAGLQQLQQQGIIRRMGLIVRHHELGYRANAMVVWNIPDPLIVDTAQRLTQFDFISLCYQRRRCLPHWPFNLYCMIHGQARQQVLAQIDHMVQQCQLTHLPREVLFSQRRFKQRGAYYNFNPSPHLPAPSPTGGPRAH